MWSGPLATVPVPEWWFPVSGSHHLCHPVPLSALCISFSNYLFLHNCLLLWFWINLNMSLIHESHPPISSPKIGYV